MRTLWKWASALLKSYRNWMHHTKEKDFQISSKIMPNKTETRLLWPPSHSVFKQESRGGEKGVVLPLLFPPSSSHCALSLSSTSNPLADITVASLLSVPRLPYFFPAPPPPCCAARQAALHGPPRGGKDGGDTKSFDAAVCDDSIWTCSAFARQRWQM